MRKEPQFVEAAPNFTMSTLTGNIYEFTDKSDSRSKPKTTTLGGVEVVSWGKRNMMPYELRQTLAENDIKQNLINSDVDITVGKGIVMFEEVIEEGKLKVNLVEDRELRDWIDDNNYTEFYRETVQDVKEFGNSWAEFITTRGSTMSPRKLYSLQSLDAVDCRLAPVDIKSGRIDSPMLYVGDWKYSSISKENIHQVPLMDIRRPNIDKMPGKFALHVKKIVSGMPYYTLVEWYGTIKWTEVANTVPKFHLQGLKNGYMLRYHIKIPMSYFDQKIAKLDGTFMSIAEMKKQLQDQLDSVLGTEENAHKAFFSFINDKLGIQHPTGWTIEKIETDLKDESFLKLHETASKVHARGHNLHPVLAGIETSGSLSSGSEILNLLNYHVAYKTQRIRDIAMRPLMLAKNYNFPGKKNIKLGVQDVELTTTDKNPTGKQNTVAA